MAMTATNDLSANGQCPACGMPVPFLRANLRRGKTYDCPACHRTLRTGKVSVGLAISAFAIASLAGKQVGLGAVLLILAGLAVYEWLTVRVSVVEDAHEREADPGSSPG